MLACSFARFAFSAAVSISISIMVNGLLPSATYAFDMGLSPAKVEETVLPNTEKTVVYSLSNGSTTAPLRIQVLVYDWKVDDTGELVTPKPGSYEYSASDWVEVTPTEFVVKPRQTQIIRATYKVPAGTPPGDYLTCLMFRQRVVVPKAKAQITGQLIPEGLIGSLAYINVPGGDKKPTLQSMKFVPGDGKNPAEIQWTIKNEGSVHVRPTGNISIKDATDKTAASAAFKNLSVILRNSAGVRSYKLSDDLPAGKYVAELNLDLDPETYKYEKGTLSFEIPLKKQPEVAAPVKSAPVVKSGTGSKPTPAISKPKPTTARPTVKPR
jgi:hypothetical protein